MVGRRDFIVAVAVALVATALEVAAQQPKRIARVGMLLPGAAGSTQSSLNLAAFERGLRELGWDEGRNIAIERRYAAGDTERYRELALDLVRANVDVIVPAGGPASLRAAREATTIIPIVMVASSRDPVAEGIVRSFARPEGNVTGIVTLPVEGGGKLLEILKEAVPGLSRVGVLWDLSTAPYRVSKEIDSTARALGVNLVPLEVRGPVDFDRAMSDARRAQVDGLLVASTPLMGAHRKEIADLAKAYRLPAIALFRGQAEAGLLVTYGPSITEEFRRAASFVDRILRGSRPGDLPVEQPSRFELVINLGTAREMGISMPQSLLLRADEVIQ